MSKITFAFAAILALQIASGNVINWKMEDPNIADQVSAAIAQFEVEIKDVVEIHEKTGQELKKIEEESKALILRGEGEVLKRYMEIIKVIDQTIDNDHNDSCKEDANKNLSNAIIDGWKEVKKSLRVFVKNHIYPWEKSGLVLKKVESYVGSFLLESYLCEKGDDPCFKEVLDDVQEEREYVREELKKRVYNEQQGVVAAGPVLAQGVLKIKDDVLALLNTILGNFNECLN